MAENSNMKDFLNAKAMITPGAAGAVIMTITNTCSNSFHIPGVWISIALSLCVAALVAGVTDSGWWQKIALTVFNTLFIFSMAVGTNSAGAHIVQQASPSVAMVSSTNSADPAPPAEGPQDKKFFHDWFNQ